MNRLISLLLEPLRIIGVWRDEKWLIKNSVGSIMVKAAGAEVTQVTHLINGHCVYFRWPDHDSEQLNFVYVYPQNKQMTSRGILHKISQDQLEVVSKIATRQGYEVIHTIW